MSCVNPQRDPFSDKKNKNQKEKKMKKAIASVLAVLTASVCAFSASCGKNNNNPSSEDTGDLTGVTYNERTGEIYADSKDGKTAIKISYTPGFGDTWAIQSARSFLLSEEGKDYYMILNSDSELTTSVSSKLESETNLSDIYFPLASNWYSYAALGQLANLDDLYSMTIPGETKTEKSSNFIEFFLGFQKIFVDS